MHAFIPAAGPAISLSLFLCSPVLSVFLPVQV